MFGSSRCFTSRHPILQPRHEPRSLAADRADHRLKTCPWRNLTSDTEIEATATLLTYSETTTFGVRGWITRRLITGGPIPVCSTGVVSLAPAGCAPAEAGTNPGD